MITSMIEAKVPEAEDVTVTEDTLKVELSDGRTISVPLAWYPRLVHAVQEERDAWELIGEGQGIRWAALDEDLSVEGLIAGRPSGRKPTFPQTLAGGKAYRAQCGAVRPHERHATRIGELRRLTTRATPRTAPPRMPLETVRAPDSPTAMALPARPPPPTRPIIGIPHTAKDTEHGSIGGKDAQVADSRDRRVHVRNHRQRLGDRRAAARGIPGLRSCASTRRRRATGRPWRTASATTPPRCSSGPA